MANRGIGATFRIPSGIRYSIENDGIIDVFAKSGDKDIEHKRVRLIGMSILGDAIRVVPETGGINEIPVSTITKVVDSNKDSSPFSCVKAL